MAQTKARFIICNAPGFFEKPGALTESLACLLWFRASAKVNPIGGTTIATGGGRRSATHIGSIVAIAIRALTGSHLQGRGATSAIAKLEIVKNKLLA